MKGGDRELFEEKRDIGLLGYLAQGPIKRSCKEADGSYNDHSDYDLTKNEKED